MRSNPQAWEIIFLILLFPMLLSSLSLEVVMITRYFMVFSYYLFIFDEWIKSTGEGPEILTNLKI